MTFASIVFLCSFSLSLFLPVCFYDLSVESKREQLNDYNSEVARRITDPSGGARDVREKLTIKRLLRNISLLSEELRQLKVTVRIYEKFGKIVEKDSSLTTFGSKLHQNILITSIPHSGDVFLGELFNRNPDVFYLFEPFHSLKYFRENRPPEIYDYMVSSFLQGIFSCDFAKFSHFTEFLSRQYRALVYRLSSRTLSSPPLCPEIVKGRYYNIRLCTYLRPPTLSAICKLHSYTVVKTTQIIDLERLSQLAGPDGSFEYPFRVVELVRDPRAIAYTLLKEELHDNVTKAFFARESWKVCTQQLRNIRYVRAFLSKLRDRYIMVKYEDLISYPLRTVNKLYNFLGISMSNRIRSWLTEALRDGFTWPAVPKADRTFSAHTTTKNLTRSLSDWQNGLTDFQIRLVERECSEVMYLLNYKIFRKFV